MPGKSHASSDKAKVLADSIQDNTRVLIRYIAALSGQRIPAEVADEAITKLRKMLFNIPAVYNHTWPFQQASLATKAQKIESQDIFSAVAMAQNDILNELHGMVPLSPEAIYFSKIDSVVRFLEIGEQRPRKGWEYAMNKGYLCNLTLKNFLINFGLEMDVLHRDFPQFEWSRYEGYGKSRETRKWHQMCKALGDHIMCQHLLAFGSKSRNPDESTRSSSKGRGSKRVRPDAETAALDFSSAPTPSNPQFRMQSTTPSDSLYYVEPDDDADMGLPNSKRARGPDLPPTNLNQIKIFSGGPPPVSFGTGQENHHPDDAQFYQQYAVNARNPSNRTISTAQLSSAFGNPTGRSLSNLYGDNQFDAGGAGKIGRGGGGGSNARPIPNPIVRSMPTRQNLPPQVRLLPDQPPSTHSAAPSILSDGSASSVSMQSMGQPRGMPTHSSSYPFFGGDDPYAANETGVHYSSGSHSVGNSGVSSQPMHGAMLPSVPSSATSFPSTSQSMPISCSSDMNLLAEAITDPTLRSSSMSLPNFDYQQASSMGYQTYQANHTPTTGTSSSGSAGARSAPNVANWSNASGNAPEQNWTTDTIRQFELMQAAAKQLQQIQESFQNLAAQAAVTVERQHPQMYGNNQGGPAIPEPNFTTLTFDNSQYFHNNMDVDHGMDVDLNFN